MTSAHSATGAWHHLISDVLTRGAAAAPRGLATLEVFQRTTVVDMRYPVLLAPRRGLNYRFMAAEAFWIISGDDRVSTIAPYNAKIADFSDDGTRFFGAYGPKIVDQLGYVVDRLVSDSDTRQAGLTIWRENPPETKDVPCTIAIFFSRRNDLIHAHVFMRSSDCWLGVPYDVFNFSMLAHYVCGLLRRRGVRVSPGVLYLTAANAHLYEPQHGLARDCLADRSKTLNHRREPATPPELYSSDAQLLDHLKALRDSRPGSSLRWWEQP